MILQEMKKTLTVLSIALLLFACNSGTQKAGADSGSEKIVALEEIMSSGEELKDQLITVSGMVDHVCRHGGQKLFLRNDSGDVRLLVLVTESIPEFDIALEGSDIEVTGKLAVSLMEDLEKEHSMEEGEMAETTEKEECAEDGDTAAAGDAACTTSLTYHIEATSFKEIIPE